MSNLCVIPARGGSKRIPRKNIKRFCGKPIIAYSIEAALQSNCFDKVIVSTDDQEIADIAIQYGAEVPFLRSKDLADDFTGTNAVVVDVIDYYYSNDIEFEAVACIYATAPFLNKSKIIEAMMLLENHSDIDYSVSVTKYLFPIQRSLKMLANNTLALREPKYANTRSQDLEVFYHDAGQIYCGRPSSFRDKLTVFESNVLPVILNTENVQDIDTIEDWTRAEILFKVINGVSR